MSDHDFILTKGPTHAAPPNLGSGLACIGWKAQRFARNDRCMKLQEFHVNIIQGLREDVFFGNEADKENANEAVTP